jgi:hypothetical protein
VIIATGVAWLMMNSATPCASPAIDSGWAKWSDDATMATIRNVPACWIEPGLPQTTLAEWLQDQVGGGVTIRWELVVGCMLAPTGGRYPELPLCVKASWSSHQDQYGGQVVLSVGRVRRDGRRRLTRPSPELLFIWPISGGVREGSRDASSLADLAQRVHDLRGLSGRQ